MSATSELKLSKRQSNYSRLTGTLDKLNCALAQTSSTTELEELKATALAAKEQSQSIRAARRQEMLDWLCHYRVSLYSFNLYI